MKKVIVFLLCFTMLGCASFDKGDKTFVATAFSLNLLGLQIPENSHANAESLLPKDGIAIKNVIGLPTGWETFPGAVMRIIGIGYTQISGEIVSHK